MEEMARILFSGFFLIIIFFSRACSFYYSYRLGMTRSPYLLSLLTVGSLGRQMWDFRTEIHCRMANPLETLHAPACCFPHSWAWL